MSSDGWQCDHDVTLTPNLNKENKIKRKRKEN